MKKEEPKPVKTEEPSNPFAGRKYIRAVGRRKSASANVKLYAAGSGNFVINRRPLETYFPEAALLDMVGSPLREAGSAKQFDVNVNVAGGGPKGQAEAVRLGLARALVISDEKLKPALRKLGYLTVDARVKERKKPGLKRARRAPQWAKR